MSNSNTHSNLQFECQDFFMLRTPLLPINKYLEVFNPDGKSDVEKLENINKKIVKLIEDPLIREAIAVASPSLCKSLPHIQEEKDSKKKKQALFSFIRFLIRMMTRPTPYGLFAGVSKGDFATHTKVKLTNYNQFKKRVRPDMEWLYEIIKLLESNPMVINQVKVFFNQATYIHGDRLKLSYHTMLGKQSNEAEEIESVNVRFSDALEEVKKLTQNSITFSQLQLQLQKKYEDVPLVVIEEFLKTLITQEILLTELRPPLVNTSTFDYLMNTISSIEGIDEFKKSLGEISNLISDYNSTSIGKGEKLYNHINSKMSKLVENTTSNIQVDLALGDNNEINLNKNIKNEIESVANLFWEISLQNSYSPLTEYRNAFIEKYGVYQEVPLLELLDRDMGLGVPATYESSHRNGLYHPIHGEESNQQKLITSWALEAIYNREHEINLTDEKLAKLRDSNKKVQHIKASSMELYFTLASNSSEEIDAGNYQLTLSPNPGSNAVGQTFGRFMDLFSDDDSLRSELKKVQQENNLFYKEAIHAELVYLPNKGRTANIATTGSVKPYEIAIGTMASKDESHVIPLSDLYIGAAHNHFYIYSKKLDREIIPTTSHMLNTQLGPSIFRFLSDIIQEREGSWSKINFGKLEDSPMLPRIRLGKVILSPARWLLKHDFLNVNNNSFTEWTHAFKEWQKNWNVPQYIYLVEFDNRLLLDLNNPLHLEIVKQELDKVGKDRALKLIEIEGDIDAHWVEGSDGKYIMEGVFPLVRKQEVSKSTSQISLDNNYIRRNAYIPYQQRVKFLGSDWLFIKLYGMSEREEEFLSEELKPWIENCKDKNWADYLFFMRYSDPEPHIRLRFHGDPDLLIHQGIPEIITWTNDLKIKGLLNRLVIDAYDPEIERYGGNALIGHAEKLFYTDSNIVLEWLKWKKTDTPEVSTELFGVVSTIHYLEGFNLSFEEQLAWLERYVDYKKHLKEFRKNRNTYMKYGNSQDDWQTLRSVPEGESLYRLLKLRNETTMEYLAAINQVKLADNLSNDFNDIVASVIHLHLNRLVGIDREREDKIMTLAYHTLRNLRYTREIAHA
ncbi:lantibiotic dehydratase [Bacillus pseudomycoides]|uniref:lantibiotic dehydratase n=1 Tax=Bacillus TaxID=1386 RepID=UPI0018F35005|nr:MULTISPECIES: lantibiotic dehydratase [Bacillus]MBJ8031169.1 lantibiotic dehydratase [Bacillus cereus group sp. N21]MCX2829652.1 lantibiotic dehydratase [Bacillus sp. DHT2]MDR4919095.1 lantibiotic dehydratase [Bacillus pseudomycoides]